MPDWVSPTIFVNVELRFYDLSGNEAREILQPKAGLLAVRIAELIWMHILRWLFVHRGYYAHWILKADAINIALEKALEKIQSIFPLLVPIGKPVFEFWLKPLVPSNSKVGARRVGDHQIPIIAIALINQIKDTALIMRAGYISRKKVAGNGFVSCLQECIANSP
jgi:hypothetical protein